MMAPPSDHLTVQIRAYQGDEQIVELEEPVLLTMRFGTCVPDGQRVVVVQRSEVVAARVDTLTGDIDHQNNLITVSVDHLSLFELAYP